VISRPCARLGWNEGKFLGADPIGIRWSQVVKDIQQYIREKARIYFSDKVLI
jgi:hypothetical protein